MASSMAQVEPLPLVPPTTNFTPESSSPMRPATSRTRSRPMSIAVAWMDSRYCNQSDKVAEASGVRTEDMAKSRNEISLGF
ncbi:hypothetical protein D3C85_1725890 [compost metagenome]